jgi:hypothetical protein
MDKTDKTQGGERVKRILALAESLLTKRDEAIQARASDGCEQRWVEDEKIYNEALSANQDGSPPSPMMDYVTGKVIRPQSNATKKGSKVVVNVIRGRTEVCAGRFSDTIMPTNDRNWGLKATPDPDMDGAMADTSPAVDINDNMVVDEQSGQQIRISDIARKKKEKADKRMAGMETYIDDQLTECKFNAECRKVVFNAAKLGTGVLKGPVVVRRIQRKWVETKDESGSAWSQERIEQRKPESYSVDPDCVYPAPGCGDNIRKAPYIWERGTILPRELRDLKKMVDQGYIPELIEIVLSDSPKRTTTVPIKGQPGKYAVNQDVVSSGLAYEKWEYHGDVDKEDLIAMGCDCEGLEDESYTACVIMANDIPIKAAIYPCDGKDLIYDFFQWSEVSGSVFGSGNPRAAAWSQKVITAAWRAMMDNAREMAGAHVIRSESVTLQEKIGCMSMWVAPRDIKDVRQALNVMQITNNQAALQQIIELALRFMDMETTTPMLFQGEKRDMPETLGQTDILVDSSNVANRNRAVLWDDEITVPHLTRYYDLNMQDPECPSEYKGDYNVDPKGARILVEKQHQANMVKDLLLLKGDPDFSIWYDWKKGAKVIANILKMDIMKSDTEIKQLEEERRQQPPPSDPRIETAKIKASGEMEKEKLRQNFDIAEIKAKEQAAKVERDHEMQLKQFDFAIKQMEMAEESKLTLADLKAKLTESAYKLNLQRELSVVKTKPAEQVATPVSEPGQRAAPGEAFQQ